MSAQDPLLDFATESTAFAVEATAVPVSQVSTSSLWTVIPAPPIHAPKPAIQAPSRAIQALRPAIQAARRTGDTTSWVLSFVAGLVLASVVAWLGSQPSGDVVSATPETESVAPAVGSVVTGATVVTPSTPAAAVTITSPSVSGVPPAARATAAPQPPAQSAPPSAERRRPAVSGYRGALVLNSNPEGADVLLNGKVVGQTPIVLNDLPAGSRALLMRRAGYAPWSASVRIVANQRTAVRATLAPSAD